MIKLIRSLILFAIIVLVLTSCDIFSNPALELKIQANSSGPYNTVGQVIKFTYTIKNIGTAPLPGTVIVTSDKSTVNCPNVNTIGNFNDSLNTDETIICTADYPITQSDLDKGSVMNIATADINGVLSNPATSDEIPVGIKSVLTTSPLTLTTTANPATYDQIGQVITYTYTINYNGAGSPGPVQFTVTDNPVSPTPFPCSTPYTPLPATQTVTCTRPYTITSNDLNAVSITNIATASDGTLQSPSANFTINKASNVLILTTTAIPTTYDKVGQLITFKYEIKNNGAVNLGPTQFTVTDTLVTPQTFNCGPAATTLTPGQALPCNAPGPYVITAADMTAVSVANLASASDSPVTVTSQKVSATVNRSGPSANLSPNTTIPHKVEEGEWLWQIARCYGADPQKVSDANPPTPSLIFPNTTVTVPNIGSVGIIYGPPCVVPHTVQSTDTWDSIALKYNADVTVLKMVNLSLTPGSVIKVPINSAGATVTPLQGLTLTTTANPLTYDQVGQVITYTYVIKNNGNTTLGPAQFTVSDSLISLTPINCGNATTSLSPSLTVTCTATYTVTVADLTAVSITNIATASGGGAGPSASVSTTINKLSTPTDAIRITFAQGTTSATINGTLNAQAALRYVVAGAAGQVMTVTLTATPANEIAWAVYNPSGVAIRPIDANSTWTGTLPANGDYRIDLSGIGSSNKTYSLTVSITP